MKFAITLVGQSQISHSLALLEVAEAIFYSMKSIGIDVVFDERTFHPDRRHILFCAHLIPASAIKLIPKSAIIFNYEQLSSNSKLLTNHYWEILRQHEVWDYSILNIQILKRANVRRIHHVPFGFVQELNRIPALPTSTDILFYGSMNNRREKILSELVNKGVKVKYLFNTYSKARDVEIAKSKYVLNLHFYDSQLFEFARCGYLLTNGRAIVSESGRDSFEKEFSNAMEFSSYEKLVERCLFLLSDDDSIFRLQSTSLNIMRSRPQQLYLPTYIRKLSRAISTLNLHKEHGLA